MLTSLNGYIENNKVIVNENITSWQGRNVIVTILDSLRNGQSSVPEDNIDEDSRKKAAIGLSGLWKEHDNTVSVDKTVRDMRRGRIFDN